MQGIGDAASVARALEPAASVYLAGHEHPDGDAIGSVLALRLALLEMGKQVACATPTPAPERYGFLPGFEHLGTTLPDDPPDLAIALDCDGISRLGDLTGNFERARTVIDIDHHRPESAFGGVRFVQPGYAATSLMVLEVLREAGAIVTPEIATCLYTGVIADTGGFRFTNTSPQVMRAGAELVEAGADPAELARLVFSLRPFSVRMLTGRTLESLHRSDSGRVLVAMLTLEDFAETGTEPDDTDGLIDEFRDTIGADVALLLKQVEPKEWSASLRSQGVNVAQVAAEFGGGGHPLASGCTVEGDGPEVERRLLASIEARLDEAMSDA